MYSTNAGGSYASTATVYFGQTLRIKATFSEPLKDSPVVKLAIDNAILSASNMTKTSTTIYYYDLVVADASVPTATCSLSVGTDLAGNVVTSAPTANATFTVDSVPTLTMPIDYSQSENTTSGAKTITVADTEGGAIDVYVGSDNDAAVSQTT